MRATLLSLAAIAALLPCAAGCSQSSQVVRGQTPVGPGNPPPGTIIEGEDCYVGDECDGHGCRWCHGGGCCHCRPYYIPRDLVYPPPGDLPAIVQYPYYTCKGPDCFFAGGLAGR